MTEFGQIRRGGHKAPDGSWHGDFKDVRFMVVTHGLMIVIANPDDKWLPVGAGELRTNDEVWPLVEEA